MPSLHDLGWGPYFDRQVTDDERARCTPARVVWESRVHYRLATADAEWHGELAGRLRYAALTPADVPTVGDWVLAVRRPGQGTATIQRRLDRRSAFTRGAAGRLAEQQVIAANVDTVLLVTSCNRDFNVRRIERYLALAWQSGANPIIVVNKADLAHSGHEAWHAEMAAVAQGVPIVVASALRGDGLDVLRSAIQKEGITTALLGSSGVGKSTLVNALVGADLQDVAEIRGSDARGRHRTTARQLCCLRGGGLLIDTPGMRELQLLDAEDGVRSVFADVEALGVGCRFRDCSHEREPGCAVLAALDEGALAGDRLESYRKLRREEQYLRDRHGGSARAKRRRQGKLVARSLKWQDKLRRR
ncbi:MAG: ribosome small subunit-dependent GTPase A [Vicinamibacterales bacterium]